LSPLACAARHKYVSANACECAAAGEHFRLGGFNRLSVSRPSPENW
jgi:hypothetical protein